MPNELVTSFNFSVTIGLITIVFYPIVKGYIAESIEYKKNIHYTDAEKQTDIDVSEVMEFVRLFTVFLFVASSLVFYFYGVTTKNSVDPIVMKMFILATFLYLGHDIVWLIVGVLWFVGAYTHIHLVED
jgi:hypothetical protein